MHPVIYSNLTGVFRAAMSNSFSTVALNVQQRAIKPSFALIVTDESREKTIPKHFTHQFILWKAKM